eukprot:g3573.t1
MKRRQANKYVSSSSGGGGKRRRGKETRSTDVEWGKEENRRGGGGRRGGDDFFISAGGASSKALEDSDDEGRDDSNKDVDKDEGPTDAEKRISRAKDYLKRLMHKKDGEGGADDDYVGEKLKLEAMEASGRYIRRIAENLRAIRVAESDDDDEEEEEEEEEGGESEDDDEVGEDSEESDGSTDEEEEEEISEGRLLATRYRGHKLSATCVAIGCEDRQAFSGSKDCSIIRWDIETGKRLHVFRGLRAKKGDVANAGKHDYHVEQVTALDVSPDGRFLASGGIGRLVRIWDLRTNEHVVALRGHRDAISAMSFRQTDAENVLVTGSRDRTIKLWNVDSQTYMETLFGHQSDVMGLHTLKGDRVVSCGRDATARLWHISNESQLVFRGRGGSIDCAAMLSDKKFVTGCDRGNLEMWSNVKKKSVCRIADAHGSNNWISSVAAWENSDLVASGSCDGVIRFWKADVDSSTLAQVATAQVDGFVNGLAFAKSGAFVVAAIGQEHRLGRWWRRKGVRSGIAVVRLDT